MHSCVDWLHGNLSSSVVRLDDISMSMKSSQWYDTEHRHINTRDLLVSRPVIIYDTSYQEEPHHADCGERILAEGKYHAGQVRVQVTSHFVQHRQLSALRRISGESLETC